MSTTPRHRTCVQAVRLTPGELTVLRQRAGANAVPLAAYLRERALARRIRSRGSRLDRSDVDNLVRLGVALNGFAHTANTVRCIVGAEELALLLAEIRSTAQGLRAKLSSEPRRGRRRDELGDEHLAPAAQPGPCSPSFRGALHA